VLRFARRLGLAGYPGLRLALVEAAAAERDRDRDRGTRRLTDVSDSDTLDDIVEKVAHAGAAAVEDTARRLSRTTLAAVAEAFTAARRVDLFGVAASGLVAADLQLKLHQIGIATHAWTDAHLALTSVSLLGPGDVALVFSHSGTTVEAVEVLEAAKAAGATAVAITNAERSPVAKAADLVLLTSGNETNQRSAATASRIGALTVVDILFLATAQLNLPAATRAVAATKRAVAAHHRSR
jgi:DNA-binding MurR/RpiR family transcriptional regulator